MIANGKTPVNATKPNEKSVMIWAHRLLRSHGAQAHAWALEVSERHRLSKDTYGVVKWQTIAKRIAELQHARRATHGRKVSAPAHNRQTDDSAPQL